MTITLPLNPREEARLAALAEAKGVSPDELVREALDKILATGAEASDESNNGAPPVWEIILDNMKDVSPEELAKLPNDGASQLDHYLYGHPKRGK